MTGGSSLGWSPLLGLLLVAAAAAAAIAGVVTGRRSLVTFGKPLATLAVLLVIGLPPAGAFGWLIAVGILFSTGGDIALLGDSDRRFMGGVALFLVAHLFFTAAFFSSAPLAALTANRSFLIALAIVIPATALLLWSLWPRLGEMRIPVVVYALVITTMVAAAASTHDGLLPAGTPPAATAGAVLFYLSDANLAWNRFRGGYRHGTVVTFLLYWAGQVGIGYAAWLSGRSAG